MLPTPSTSHVDINRIYEPAEDSFLLLDTLSSDSEVLFLNHRFSEACGKQSSCPVVLEVGTGSGIVIAFLTTHAKRIIGTADTITLGTDINAFACVATAQTVLRASKGQKESPPGIFLDCLRADLGTVICRGIVDLLVFNPPYVPTQEVPKAIISADFVESDSNLSTKNESEFQEESRLLSLSYAGGHDGMEVTNSMLEQLADLLSVGRGVAYLLLCKQNKPDEVVGRIRCWDVGWQVKEVGHSGSTGGWEKLVVLRIWRQSLSNPQ